MMKAGERPGPRAGSGYRANVDRFFHVMHEGWYVHLREGIKGPFVQRHQAEEFLREFLASLV